MISNMYVLIYNRFTLEHNIGKITSSNVFDAVVLTQGHEILSR